MDESSSPVRDGRDAPETTACPAVASVAFMTGARYAQR